MKQSSSLKKGFGLSVLVSRVMLIVLCKTSVNKQRAVGSFEAWAKTDGHRIVPDPVQSRNQPQIKTAISHTLCGRLRSLVVVFTVKYDSLVGKTSLQQDVRAVGLFQTSLQRCSRNSVINIIQTLWMDT